MDQAAKQQKIERRQNLAYCFQELFTAIVRVRFNLQNVSSADGFRANAKELIRMATQEAAGLGYATMESAPRGDTVDRAFGRGARALPNVKLAAFAVVAFLDESVLTSKNPVFANWPRATLQEELFGEHLAGETFFQHVQELLSQRDSAEIADVLEVYYLCLLLGYRGRYGTAGEGEVRAIMESIRAKINRVRGTSALSPSWVLPGDPPLPRQSDPWLSRLVWCTLVAAVWAAITFGACAWTLTSGNSAIQSAADVLQ